MRHSSSIKMRSLYTGCVNKSAVAFGIIGTGTSGIPTGFSNAFSVSLGTVAVSGERVDVSRFCPETD